MTTNVYTASILNAAGKVVWTGPLKSYERQSVMAVQHQRVLDKQAAALGAEAVYAAIVLTHDTNPGKVILINNFKFVNGRSSYVQTAGLLDTIAPKVEEAKKTNVTSIKAARNARFQKGTGLYECKSCGHKTRSTGQGDNDQVELCTVCWDLAGEENHLNDSGKLYDSVGNVSGLLKVLDSRTPGNDLFPEVRAFVNTQQVSAAALATAPVAKKEKGKSITAAPVKAAAPSGKITVGDKGLGCTASGTLFTGTVGGVPFTGPDRLGRFQVKGRYVPADLADAIRAAFAAAKPAKKSRKAA